MTALSLYPRWAELVRTGRKTLEIRSWRTHYRGPLVICAGRRRPGDDPAWPAGVAVAVVELADCRLFLPADAAAACCNWSPGLYAFELADPRPIEPFPVRGQCKLFRVDCFRGNSP